MRYDFYAWADGSGSCVHSGEFDSDAEALAHVASFGPDASISVEAQESGYCRIVGGAPATSEPLPTSQQLHQAAYSYIEARIDSQARDAVMMALMTGTPVNGPKVAANQAWMQSIWVEYYVRKSALAESLPVSLDFSNFGEPPHAFQELMTP